MMMNSNRYLSLAGLVGAALLTACSFEKNAVQEIAGPAPSTGVKFFNFGVGAPGVNFYANDIKMTAISSTTGIESTNGVTYGNAGAGALYTGINPAAYTLAGKIAAATDKDLVISNVSATLADGKYYSYYQSGIYNTTAKTVDAFIVEDPIPALDFSKAYVRFVNAISNAQPTVLTITPTTAGTGSPVAIGGAIAYKSAGEFVGVPGDISYTLSARVAGSATDLVTRTGITFATGRVYTITARGSATVATGTNAPFLDNTANR